MKSIVSHLPHYLSLAGILIAGAVAFTAFSYDQEFQTYVALSVGVAYILWGIIHHKIHNDLNVAVVIEYILVAVLGLVVVSSLIIR